MVQGWSTCPFASSLVPKAPELFQPGEEVALGDLTAASVAMGKSTRTQTQALYCSEWMEDINSTDEVQTEADFFLPGQSNNGAL